MERALVKRSIIDILLFTVTTDIRRAIQYPMTDKREQKGLRIEGIRCGGGLVDTGDKTGYCGTV